MWKNESVKDRLGLLFWNVAPTVSFSVRRSRNKLPLDFVVNWFIIYFAKGGFLLPASFQTPSCVLCAISSLLVAIEISVKLDLNAIGSPV